MFVYCSEVGDKVRPIIRLQSCLEALYNEEYVDDFYSSAVGDKVVAKK